MTDPTINIRNALVDALASITPVIDIVHQNEAYSPQPDDPYCEVYLLPANPANPTMGNGFYREQGILQINLQYPPRVGTLDCETRAGLIRSLFKRGASFSDGGVTVLIDKTPEMADGSEESGRWKQIIKVRWYADIYPT
jgi:hypothetical protein